MKEVTYGWYPSVKDIYRPKGRPSSHHLKCLYNFHDYQGQPVIRGSELFVRGVSSSMPPDTTNDRRRKSKSAPIPKLRSDSKIDIPTPTECWSKCKTQETQWVIVDELSPKASNPPSEVSWPILQGGKQPQQFKEEEKNLQYKQQLLKEHIQKQQERYILESNQIPQNAWGIRKPSQDSSHSSPEVSSKSAWPVAHKAYPLRPQSSYSGQSTTYQQEKAADNKQRPASSPVKSLISSAQSQRDISSAMMPTPPSRDIRRSAMAPTPPSRDISAATKRNSRVQSAIVRHEKVPLPARPVTAFSGRHSAQEQEPIQLNSPYDETEGRAPARPATPVSFARYNNETASHLPVAGEPSRSPACQDIDANGDNYETIVERYGWRAQVHGDPYRLKKPVKRESYVVTCTAPDLLPDPPSIHMETKEPFFYNTIPKKPLSFSVDREWMSEVLLAKRLELQKRDSGIKYNYKNFAFVY